MTVTDWLLTKLATLTVNPQSFPRSVHSRTGTLSIYVLVQKRPVELHSTPVWLHFFDKRCLAQSALIDSTNLSWLYLQYWEMCLMQKLSASSAIVSPWMLWMLSAIPTLAVTYTAVQISNVRIAIWRSLLRRDILGRAMGRDGDAEAGRRLSPSSSLVGFGVVLRLLNRRANMATDGE
jgi:hypothetical protein